MFFYEFGLNDNAKMNELYAFVIQKWTWGTRKSNKKEGKLKHWLTSAYLFQFIFWPSKIKIVCLSRVNDFYDNHRFMFSAVYIFCVRSRIWGRDIRDASDLINLYILYLFLAHIWTLCNMSECGKYFSCPWKDEESSKTKNNWTWIFGWFDFSFPRVKSDFLDSNLWCNQTQACVNLIKHIIQSDTRDFHTPKFNISTLSCCYTL